MRWRRNTIAAAAALAAVVIIAVVVGLGRIDAVVKREIEVRGSAITQTAVQVGSIDVSLHDSTVTLRDLTVANPPGFTAPYAFELGEITVHIAIGSVASDPLVIREIRIAAPRVTCELDASGTTNVEILRRTVEDTEHREPHDAPPAGAPDEARTRAPKRPRRLIIEVLALRDGEVHVDARAVGGPEEREKLPGFELTDIGTKQGGATPPEIGRIVITALARDVAVAVAATQLERYIGKEGSEWLKKGGAEVIRKGLGNILDQILR